MTPGAAQPAVVVLGDMRDLHHHGCEAVMRVLIDGLTQVHLPPSNVIAGLNWEGARETAVTADLVVINGEGALHDSRSAVVGVLRLAELRRAAGRPTALVNSSWFDNDAALTRRLSAFDLVSFRDPYSVEEAMRHGVHPMLIPDFAVRHAVQFTAERGASRRTNPPMVSDSTRPPLTRQLRRLAAQRGWTYLPVLASPTTHRPGAKSRKIVRRTRIARLLGPLAPYLLSERYHAHALGEPTLNDYCSRLAAASGVVSGRFHTVCLALGLGVPLLAVASNTPKIEGVLKLAGLDPAARCLSADALSQCNEVPAFTPAEETALTAFRERAVADVDRLFVRIGKLLSQSAR